MKRRAFVLVSVVSFLASWSVPSSAQTYGESPYVFGMHEPGGESHMADKGRKGWILFTEELGHDAANTSGGNYRPWADGGFGVLVRLNNGYGTNGTLPYEKHYDAFAQRVANFVASAPGAHIWIVGNEPNLAGEWPSYEGPAEEITTQRYASAFRKVRDRIKALPGHGGDQVLMAGLSPAFGAGFTYHSQALAAIGSGNVDGFAIHCYTAGSDPARIQQEFRDYRGFLGATPAWARSLPAYITETDEGGPWTDANTGWVKAAYAEIDAWNRTSGNQQVRSLVLYRWPRNDAYYIEGKNGVIADWREAMNNDYRWGVGGVALDADILDAQSSVPTSMVAGETRDVVVRVLNKGTSAWGAGSAVRLGALASNNVAWSQFQCGGYANGLADARAFLCADVAPGATAELRFKITAPASGPATFGARMVKDGVQWFGDQYTVAIAISGAGCIQTVAAGHWKGEYFANTGLSGSPSLVRDDGVGPLAFDWGSSGPNSCGVGVDRFSARWSRTTSFEAGTWGFTATVDDGVRLYVDGQLKIDAWIDQAPKAYTADVALAAGSHSLVMEYYENAGGAVASLAWTKVGGTTSSKLSLHSGGGSLSMQFVSDTRPPVVKLLDNLSAAAEIKQRSPGTKVIARIYEDAQPMDGDPGQRAQEWWNRNRDRILGAPAVDYWEGYNEPGVGTLAEVQWYAQFEAARVNILAANGRKACIGNFSTGTPDVNDPAIWPAFYPAIDAALAHGGILGLHEYGTPMQQYYEGDVASGRGWLCGRYRRVYQGFLAPTSRVIPLAITETGVDGACPGWRNCYNEDQYLGQLEWYDAVLRQDAYVLGAAIFQLEIPGWYPFDISPLMVKLTQYVQSQQGPPPANRAPTAVIDASPTSGAAPLTVLLDGSGSSDPDGDALSYSWSFGDGQQGSGAQVSHTYGASGSFTATLTVGDGKGGSASAGATITVVSAPPSGNLVSNGDFSQGLTGWTTWKERGNPAATVSNGQLRVSGTGYNGGVYQRFDTGGAGKAVTVGGFWATDPAAASAQWGEVLVINGTRLPIDGQDVANGQADVVLVYKNDTWASPSGWSGSMGQTAPAAHPGSFVAAGNVATIVLKSGNLAGVTSGVRFDDVVVSNGGVPANRPPTAVVSASPTSGPPPLTVQFDGSGSSDPDGDALSYGWSFGDGSQGSGAQASHTYGANGSFTATLTVSDGKGGTANRSIVISVGSGPPAGVQWDNRLTRLGVTLVPASGVAPGQGYWRLVKAQYEDDGEILPGPCSCSESGGNHHVYYKVLRADGTPIENQKCVADWPNPGPTYTADVYTKGADPLDDYWGNFPLTGHPSWCPYYLDGQGPRGIYGASVAGAPSDKVWGMDLPCSHHVNFRFTWQWTVASTAAPTPADPHLASFPRPQNDNGRGLHFVLDARDSVVQRYAPFLGDMQIKWATVYGGDELQVTRVARYLLDTYGIYSNLRVQDLVDRPKSSDFYRVLTELCLQQGIPPYVQIFNEPEDGREWEGSSSTETFGYNWKARAEAVAQAGGYPGLQVLSKEFFDAAMTGVSDLVKQRMYFSLHNYGANHPPSYPYPQATVMEDDTAVLRFLEYAHWFRSTIGFVPPMIGGEGGWGYENHDDASMPAVTIDLWVPWHQEMFDWFRTGRLSNGELLPDYLFSVNPWIMYATGWYADSWVDGLHSDLKAELIRRLKDSPPYVRSFTGVR